MFINIYAILDSEQYVRDIVCMRSFEEVSKLASNNFSGGRAIIANDYDIYVGDKYVNSNFYHSNEDGSLTLALFKASEEDKMEALKQQIEYQDRQMELLEQEKGLVFYKDVKSLYDSTVYTPNVNSKQMIELLETYLSLDERKNLRLLDLCCGCGIIGLAIKKYFPDIDVTLSDIDENAVRYSNINAELNNVEVNVLQSDLFENVNDSFDYISITAPCLPETYVPGENNHILDNPRDTVILNDRENVFKKIVEQSYVHLNNEGVVMIYSCDNALTKLIGDEIEAQNFKNVKTFVHPKFNNTTIIIAQKIIEVK